MPDNTDDAPFTRLGSLTPVEAPELTELYAYPPELDRCWVRANMIASADGAATLDGKAGGLAGPGDRALFAALRELADVVLVGAGTVRAENYSGAQLGVAARQARQARGQPEVPPIAIVTTSGTIEPDSKVFVRTEVAPLIFTTAAAHAATRERLHSAEVIDASTSDTHAVDLAAVLDELARRGLRRVLCEGGPSFLGDLVERALIDEFALTLAPMLVGGDGPRVAAGAAPVSTGLQVTHILSDEGGYLYLLYRRAGGTSRSRGRA